MTKSDFLQKIKDRTAVVGIVGLGYVGLPLAVAFAAKGLRTLGFEKDKNKVEQIESGLSYIGDVTDGELSAVVNAGHFAPTTDAKRTSECDAVLICVPTPLDRFKKPDLSYVEAAGREIGAFLRRGALVCLESTTFPTTTENVLLPILEAASGLTCGSDFHLAYSPERVDPGNTTWKTENTPKVLGAMSEDGLEIGLALYRVAVTEVHPVSSPRIAEMVKILENTYRMVNISLVNELALLCGKMEIDIWEVIEAAKTKPYGFQAFYPGPGIGGHCIPLDPFYLEYIAKNYAFELTMIHSAGHIDTLMPHRMMIKITSALNRQKKPVNGSRLLFLGVAFKPNVNDARESPALKIMDEAAKKGADVAYHDPHIATVKTPEGRELASVSLDGGELAVADCVIITTKHASFDFDRVEKEARLIVDLQNAVGRSSEKVYRL